MSHASRHLASSLLIIKLKVGKSYIKEFYTQNSLMAESSNVPRKEASEHDSTVYLNPYFHFDPKANITEDLVFKCKAILTNEQFWNAIQDGLDVLLKEAGAVILFQMGLRYGVEVGSKAKEAIPDVHQAVKFLETYGLFSGWGKFTTSPFSLSMGHLTDSVTVKVENSFFATMGKKKWETPRCFLISGLLAGITEGLLGEGHNCIETKCMATGSKYCEFLITRRK